MLLRPRTRILQGDSLAVLRTLPSDWADCVITSPPYWGLRDYGVEGQMGLEATLGEHVAAMVEVFREVRRVLKPTGTMWLNYGDSYATAPNGRSAADTKAAGRDDRTFRDKPFSTVGPVYDPAGGAKGGGFRGDNKLNGSPASTPNGRIVADGMLKPKDLCGMPWRVALALQDDGWWLRQDIIWAKSNPMPESIQDRCTKAHEYLFLMTKSERYYFDNEAIKEPAGYDPGKTKFPDGWDTAPGGHGTIHRSGREKGRASGNKTHKGVAEYEASESEHHRTKAGLLKIANTAYATRNKRSVWTIATHPFPGAHYATFPPALVEPCVLAGCPPGGLVLDPFLGSGTVGMVANRLGRRCVGIELSEASVDLARNRITEDRCARLYS